MGVVQRAIHEDVAPDPHDGQQDRADRGKAQDAAQDNLAQPHGFGNDCVNRLGLEIVRQAKRTEQQRDAQDQIRDRREHKADVELGRILVILLQEPTGKEQNDEKDHQGNHHAAPPGLFHGQPCQGQHAAGGGFQELAHSARNRAVHEVTTAKQAMPSGGHAVTEYQSKEPQTERDQKEPGRAPSVPFPPLSSHWR